MKRKQRDDIKDKKVKWRCDGCKGIIANPYPKADNKEVEYVLGKGKGKIKELKILQWNAEAYLSKKEEFANLVYKYDIDVFAIQETKMVTNDLKPNIPGYEIKRRYREQVIGSEDNRGGGLIDGAKETIPVSVIQNYLSGVNDDVTELLTGRIRTSL